MMKQADSVEATDGPFKSNHPMCLQSPFEYTQELITGQVHSTAQRNVQRLNTERRLSSESSLRYIYFAPTNPSDRTIQKLDAHRKILRRQLSYGDSPGKSGSRSLHKSAGSRELRYEAERHAERYQIGTQSNSITNAPAARHYDSDSTKSKVRLWLDLSEPKYVVQEAVSILKPGETQEHLWKTMLMVLKHIIRIKTNPLRPQVICTPCRRAPVGPFGTTTPVFTNQGLLVPHPHTPPLTPVSPEPVVDLGIKPVADRHYDETYEPIKAESTWTPAPPTPSHSPTGAVRRVPSEPTTLIRAEATKATAHDRPQMSERTAWIIIGLEASVASIAPVNLQLDSPVIREIRFPPEQRWVPSKTLSLLPLVCSSLSGRLSSHPSYSSFTLSLQAGSPRNSPITITNIRSLSIIFPHASPQILSSLQATYLALQYVSTVDLPSSALRSLPLSHTRTSPWSSMPYIPAKARAMLGLPAPWMQPETQEWRNRIENLQCRLRREVVRLIRMCERSDLGKNESLIRAVGQVVEYGQARAHRYN